MDLFTKVGAWLLGKDLIELELEEEARRALRILEARCTVERELFGASLAALEELERQAAEALLQYPLAHDDVEELVEERVSHLRHLVARRAHSDQRIA